MDTKKSEKEKLRRKNGFMTAGTNLNAEDTVKPQGGEEDNYAVPNEHRGCTSNNWKDTLLSHPEICYWATSYRTLTSGVRPFPVRAKMSLSHASFPCGVTRAT
jgi:hypothetical protein